MTNGVIELVFLWIGKGFFQTWQVACRQEVYNTKIPSEMEVATCYTLLTLLTLFKYCSNCFTLILSKMLVDWSVYPLD